MALLHPHQVKCGGARAEIPPPKLSTGLLTIRLYLTNMVIASLNTHVFENWKNKQMHSQKTVQIYK